MLYPENLVWLPEDRIYGTLVEMGAYYSTVAYIKDGIEYEVFMENDEFVILEDMIEYDTDD